MKTKLIILFLFIIIGSSKTQNLNELLKGNKFNSSINFSKINTGDTIIFKVRENEGNFYFKRNKKIKEHNFVAFCGNKSLIDYFTPKSREYSKIGKWKTTSDEDESFLTLFIDQKIFILQFCYFINNEIYFILE